MSFADNIKKFADKEKARLRDAEEQAKQNLSRRLEEVLGADAKLIKGGKFDLESGTLSEIEAPQDVIDRLRAAGLIKDE